MRHLWLQGFLVTRALLAVLIAAVFLLSSGPVFAQQAVSGGGNGWAPGPDATGDNSLVGAVDSPSGVNPIGRNSAFAVTGWAVDTEAQGWAGVDQVQVWQGFMGAPGGGELAAGEVALNRADVALSLHNGYDAPSGFLVTVSAAENTLAPGSVDTLNVYVHTPGKGWWYRPFTFSVGQTQTAAGVYGADPLVVVEKPKTNENVGVSNSAFTIQGYALDRNATSSEGVGVDQVTVYIGGVKGAPNSYLLGDASLDVPDSQAASYGSQFANAGWQLTFSPTRYADGQQTIYVYAHSSVTGQTTLATQTFTIVEGTGD